MPRSPPTVGSRDAYRGSDRRTAWRGTSAGAGAPPPSLAVFASRSRVRADAAGARVSGIPEEEFVARTGQRQTGARRTTPRKQGRVHHHGDVASVLAGTAREVEAAIQGGRVTPAVGTKFKAVALLLRDERSRVRGLAAASDNRRAGQLRRLDGIAAILARIAVRDTGLLALLGDDAAVSDAARSLKRDMLRAAGVEAVLEEETAPEPAGE